MRLENIYFELSKDMDDEYYIELAEKDILVVPVLIDIMLSDNSQWAQSLLEKISENNPRLVYPYFEYITDKINDCETFLMWNIWKLISNILVCDYNNCWNKVKDDYIKALNSTQISEFSIACDCAKKIIKAKPDDLEEILKVLVDATKREFLIDGVISVTCSKVAREKVTLLLENLNNNI